MFSIVTEPWVKSCFLASSTLLRVRILLYMTMMNLSSSLMLCGSTSSGCEERVVKAPLTSSPCRSSGFLSFAEKAGYRITPAYHCLWLFTLQVVCNCMDWYVAYVAAYTKAYTKLFNVQIVEVADRSDDYINTFFIPRFAHWAKFRSIRVSASSWVHRWRLSMSHNS